MRARVVLAGLLAAAAAGCGGTTAPAPGPPAAAGTLLEHSQPAGFRARRAGSLLSLGLPRRWQALDRRAAVFPGVAQTLSVTNRGLIPYLAALGVPDSPLALLGFDPAVRGGWTTVSVLVSHLNPDSTYEQWSQRAVHAVRSFPSRRGALHVRHVSLDAGEAVRLEYVRSAGVRLLETVQYVIASGDRVYSVTYSTPAASAARYRSTFDRSARTLVVALG